MFQSLYFPSARAAPNKLPSFEKDTLHILLVSNSKVCNNSRSLIESVEITSEGLSRTGIIVGVAIGVLVGRSNTDSVITT